ncbi:hypothetical protein [Peribacillus simplex]|uniref:hypothetical protein n=1 Tax=Peribacillus simplex TaxID=1478 RepID=UPI003D2BD20A
MNVGLRPIVRKINLPIEKTIAFYVNLGTDLDQSRLYLGVYGSMKVTDFNQGTVFEIVP